MTIAPGAPSYETASGEVASGQTVGITATFKNETTTQQLGSANLFWPAGFNVVSATSSVGSATVDSVPSGAKACTYLGAANGPCVELRNLSLQPGQSFIVTMTVMTPACQQGSGFTWLAEPKQANNFSGSPGNDLGLDAANSQPNSSLDGACSLGWSTEPSSAKTNAVITSNSYAAGSAPAVTVLDQNRNPVPTSIAPVSVALATNLFAKLNGTTTQAASGGVASFGDLSITAPATGYQLSASSGTLTAATSNPPFNVTNQVVSCTPSNPAACSATDGTANGNHAQVNATPTSAGLLLESVNADDATQLNCAGYTSADPNTYQVTTPTDWGKTVTLTIRPQKKLSGPNANKILAAQQICFGAPADFTTTSGPPPHQPTTLPDGSTGFIGLLPDCPKIPTGPCHARSQDTTVTDPLSPNGFDLVLVAVIPAAFAGDPHMR